MCNITRNVIRILDFHVFSATYQKLGSIQTVAEVKLQMLSETGLYILVAESCQKFLKLCMT